LNADYTFVNERLAKHYGIPHVYGSRFRRIALDENSWRGGLLRQGSILTVTSYATRTSPVLRGAWVLGRANQEASSRATFWLGATGGMDLLLGVLLVSGLPIAMLVVTLFGPTAPIIASFSYVLAASLIVTGLAEIAISR